jgi:DNA-directed RNA polymerase specialized sigma24 family protein
MDEASSVTEWLNCLKAGDINASQKLWERYVGRAVRIAHRRLGGRPRRAADEQDIAQEAFASFFRSVEMGRFPRLDDRNDLWQVLLMLTDRKAKEHLRRELADKRGAGKVRGESVIDGISSDSGRGGAGLDNMPDVEPCAESVDDLIRLIETSLSHLPDEGMRQIMLEKLQGYSDMETATRTGLALRTVERKLQIIRRILVEDAAEH